MQNVPSHEGSLVLPEPATRANTEWGRHDEEDCPLLLSPQTGFDFILQCLLDDRQNDRLMLLKSEIGSMLQGGSMAVRETQVIAHENHLQPCIFLRRGANLTHRAFRMPCWRNPAHERRVSTHAMRLNPYLRALEHNDQAMAAQIIWKGKGRQMLEVSHRCRPLADWYCFQVHHVAWSLTRRT